MDEQRKKRLIAKYSKSSAKMPPPARKARSS